ncbi:MAG: trigger factor [Planctomycetota bacterium]|nr:trigger factor [Planctomycetota bacterium]
MKSSIKEIGPCKFQVSLEIPQDTIAAEIEKRYTELNDTVAFPGFRKGKTPRKLMEKRFSKDILNDTKGKLVSDACQKALEEHSLSPVSTPELDPDKIPFDPSAPLVFEFSVEVKPTFTVADYMGVKVKKEDVTVTDADVEEGLKRLASSRAELVVMEGEGAKDGDVIIADEEYSAEGKSFELQENATIVVSKDLRVFGQEIPALFDMLLGAKRGDTRIVTAKIPAEFKQENLRGKDATVKMIVREVKRIKVPEITDEWAKQMDFDSVAELKEAVRKRIGMERETQVKRNAQEAILADIAGRTKMDLPEGLVAEKTKEFESQHRLRLYQRGMPENQIEQEIEKGKTDSKDGVVAFLKRMFIIEEIAKKEKIFVTEEAVDARITEIASATKKWPNEVREYYEKNDLMPQLRAELREEKVLVFLLEKAQVE